ncbi:MAG: hypothetical protein ACI8ZN_002598, partial [Bacteroidia bacterium]
KVNRKPARLWWKSFRNTRIRSKDSSDFASTPLYTTNSIFAKLL